MIEYYENGQPRYEKRYLEGVLDGALIEYSSMSDIPTTHLSNIAYFLPLTLAQRGTSFVGDSLVIAIVVLAVSFGSDLKLTQLLKGKGGLSILYEAKGNF